MKKSSPGEWKKTSSGGLVHGFELPAKWRFVAVKHRCPIFYLTPPKSVSTIEQTTQIIYLFHIAIFIPIYLDFFILYISHPYYIFYIIYIYSFVYIYSYLFIFIFHSNIYSCEINKRVAFPRKFYIINVLPLWACRLT